MNLKLNLKLNPAQLLEYLEIARPYLLGIALVGAFGYTAYVVNSALNVKPADVAATATAITFDKATLDSLKNLTNVPDQIPASALGKSDPFGNN